jgi:hypothetical protein
VAIVHRRYMAGKGWRNYSELDHINHVRAGAGLPGIGTGLRKKQRQEQKWRMLTRDSSRLAAAVPSVELTSRAPLTITSVAQPIPRNIPAPVENITENIVLRTPKVEENTPISSAVADVANPEEYAEFAEESPLGMAPAVERIGTELEAERDEQVQDLQREADAVAAQKAIEDIQNAANAPEEGMYYRKSRMRLSR